ncbi:hypothetical protein LTR85_007353 [Meristemomyces frigidus]|nr:hypothetical protein LTR85_007353 [Meristemomyces frigidus]
MRRCDERRPLCANCERHFVNLATCDFDDEEPTYEPPIASSSSSAPRQPARASVQATARASPAAQPPVRAAPPVGRQAEPFQQLPPELGAGRLDPFEARPISQEPAPSIDALMNHYLSSFAFRSFPFYASRSLVELWWPFVRGDEVLFHVILLLSGLDREHLQAQDDSIHSRQMLDQCLTLLNARVRDPVASVNDHTLVAIASLVAMEHDRGNMRALDMHLEGLKRVVELRGGLDVIRVSNAMAANVVFWCAMVSINEPTLLPLTYGDQEREMDWISNPETSTLLTHDGSQADLKEFGVDVRTANVLHEVQRLSRLYTSTIEYGTPEEAVTVLSYLCSILERLLQMGQYTVEDSPIPGLSQSCRLAGCLHVFTPMSG